MPQMKEVRKHRESQLLTQGELAEKSGVTLKTIQNAESGGSLSFGSIKAIAAALGVDPREMV